MPNELPVIVAEIGTAHEGDLQRARDLIHAARDAGADMAKFQLVFAREILHQNAGSVDLPAGPIPLYERFQELERPISFYQDLQRLCQEAGIQFLCTPFGLESAGILRSMAVDSIKIASPELNFHPLLREVAGYGIPLILSTGVATIGDIAESLEVIHGGVERNVTLLHCVTAYPAPEEDYNVRVIPALANLLGVPVGISDHSVDPVLVPALATTEGATMIEKHITLAGSADGLDDAISLQPEQFAHMVRRVRAISAQLRDVAQDPVERRRLRLTLQAELADEYGTSRVEAVLGTGIKSLAKSEARNYGFTNRSIHGVTEIPAGTVLTEENTAILRTEKNLKPGLHPRYWQQICGVKTTNPIAAGQGITWEDVFSR